MRLVTFSPKASYPTVARLGALLGGDSVVDLAASYRAYLVDSGHCEREAAARIAAALLPGDMVLFLEGGSLARQAADEALQFARQVPSTDTVYEGEKPLYSVSSVRLFAPIRRPRSLRDFLSFEAHVKNARQRRGLAVPPEWYEIPAYYKGNPATIIGPDDDVVWPQYSQQPDYELEFACVLGRSGRDIDAAEADRYIAGYTIMNDFSARDAQFKEMNIGLGPAKGKDFATALGPCLVTPDELPDPYNLTMIARVNGEVWSQGNTGTMYRKFPEIIAYASNGEQLVAGDVLGSGTVGLGCGLELGRFLRLGDVVELEIEGLGILRNRVVAGA
jgi:2-keto-4-pentenoate hydratase/2-oxohepta-3-ene-1,7-dioic acid hydratase in catechol pathway